MRGLRRVELLRVEMAATAVAEAGGQEPSSTQAATAEVH